MPFKFSDASAYRFKEGDLFLGLDTKTGKEVGVRTERNAITVAGAGGGKGTCLIIPNLQRWPHAALVIDPKGENAEETWEHREKRGQIIGVLDPFKAAKVPDRVRVCLDLLAAIDPHGEAAREDVLVLADGIVKRESKREPQWDNGAATIIAGAIAYVMTAPPQHRTLSEVRKLLLQPNGSPRTAESDATGLYADAERMAACNACGGLAKAAAASIMTAIASGRGADSEYLSGARRHTAWLDSAPVASLLSGAGGDVFSLERLAEGNATLYLVLPYRFMEAHAAFLRLVVRAAQNTIAAAGNKRGNRCLFILDEFYTLGRIDEIAKAAGNMRSYGLQLWPFLQDLGQLQELYGREGSETFFANADAHCFFANNDTFTLTHVSNLLGRLRADEVRDGPPLAKAFPLISLGKIFLPKEYARDRHAVQHENKRAEYDHDMRLTGSPRFTASDLAALTGKSGAEKVARSMIVFAQAGDILNIKLSPFFNKIYFKEVRWENDTYRKSFLINLPFEIGPAILKAVLAVNTLYFGFANASAYLKGGPLYFSVAGLIGCSLLGLLAGIAYAVYEAMDSAKYEAGFAAMYPGSDKRIGAISQERAVGSDAPQTSGGLVLPDSEIRP